MAISTTTPARGRTATGRVRKTGPVRRAGSPAHRGDARLAWVLIAPAVIGFLVFAAYPTLRGIYLSFTDFRVLTPPEWTGLDNLKRLVADEVFWHSLGVTAYFVLLSVVIGMTLSVTTAVVLHRLTASTALRGVIILPFLISGVVAATTWSWMLDAQLGIVNIAIRQLGFDPVFFLGSSRWAIPTIALISVWKGMGYNAIIVFAGLQTIPPTIYEAGRIDGANEMQMFRRLTLPLLRPVLAMVLVLTVIGSFQVFDLVAVTTQGGPARASNVLQLYIYDKAFGQFEFGYAATMSLALFAMLIAITFLQMRLLRADESDTD
ncbi:sugar ABC transporter permease [Promicromonospora sp. MEB111]|uniref:carbohydrate ABC transporter permease n=1 Tax=Promicromonospora sp. MEB111 TaxID=3040301 RepID=UPI00254D434A|nr:sugar ABC transporter permease [Promicromonospora sp. MEB111]